MECLNFTLRHFDIGHRTLQQNWKSLIHFYINQGIEMIFHFSFLQIFSKKNKRSLSLEYALNYGNTELFYCPKCSGPNGAWTLWTKWAVAPWAKDALRDWQAGVHLIFLYFCNFVSKSDLKPKTKNGMNKTFNSKAFWVKTILKHVHMFDRIRNIVSYVQCMS